MEDCITSLSSDEDRRDKILTGLNFYGNNYSPRGGGPIVGHEYLKVLELFKGKLNYDPESSENYFEVKYESCKYFYKNIFYHPLFFQRS